MSDAKPLLSFFVALACAAPSALTFFTMVTFGESHAVAFAMAQQVVIMFGGMTIVGHLLRGDDEN